MLRPISMFAIVALSLSAPALALDPPSFQGKPEVAFGSKTGAWVWKDPSGLHVRFTSKKKKGESFTGNVCTPQEIVDFKPFKTDSADKIVVGPDRHCVKFKVTVAAGVDGFDFRAPGPEVNFNFNLKEKQLKTKKIFVGAQMVHPEESPFALVRRGGGDD